MGGWNLHSPPQARGWAEYEGSRRLHWGSCKNNGDRLGADRQHVGTLGGGRWLQLDCFHSNRRVAPPHVSLLSFHYIQIRSSTNFIKSKQSWSENGASRQSCGGMRETGRRNLGTEHRGGCGCSSGKGRKQRAGEGLPSRILHLQRSHHFYGCLHPSEVMPAQCSFQTLKAGRNCRDREVCRYPPLSYIWGN